MTQDEIIEMAHKAFDNCSHIPNLKIPKEFIETFAKLVAQHEREACAKVCEANIDGTPDYNQAAWNCAEAIRTR